MSSQAESNRPGSVGSSDQNKRELEGSLYPDIDDEAFLRKLLKRREFRETLQGKITDKMLEENVCNVDEFEYTSAQKFVSQFMSPNTPYNGMLLYHGVGVGKTCSAVLVAESFLQLSPKNKVFILAPPAIQAGFYRTIFDSSRITFGKESDEQNQHEGCTGNRYLEMTQTLYEREKKDVESRVNKLINKRYSIMGYVSFRNMIRDILNQIPSTLKPEKKIQQKTMLLQRALSGCLIIVDEAHNLRDVSEADDDDDNDIPETAGDASAGKKLAPFLKEILKVCEGNKLMLMSATPMYNSYKEIVSLLNLLLYVDKVDDSELLRESDIQFVMTPGGEQLTEASENKIIKIANGRVSFMRGENPRAFPARLDPITEEQIVWPAHEPNGVKEIPENQKSDVLRLPIVRCELDGEPLAVMQGMTEKLVATKGVGIRTIDTILQAGNCIFPGDGLDGRVGSEGFQSWFTARAVSASFEGTRLSTLPQYVPAVPEDSYSWMVASEKANGVANSVANGLANASPKFNKVINTIRKATGISFVYSRFVENGAVIFCLLLEANGYTPWGRTAPLFSKATSVQQGGRQCAKCSRKEAGHSGHNPAEPESINNHKFSPAFYALLTASDVNTVEKQSLPLSPNNTAVISVARDASNKDGTRIKVVVGSQVAGEGLDLRALREVHILEGWFHLSKEEQIVGRGIRYCSHNALPKQQRNCTIHLYVNSFPNATNKETIDQYTYRTAMNKAVRIGNISRALKRGAADCNLNREAILVNGLRDVEMVDSQGLARVVDINDRDYTPTCDWIRCSYSCKPSLNVAGLPDDNSTYDMFAARFAEQNLLYKLRIAFREQPWYHWTSLQGMFPDIPKETLTGLMLRVINNQSIIFENGNMKGHIIYKNNLFLFQPNKLQDTGIPIAFRYGKYPVKRDFYVPGVKPKETKASSNIETAMAFWLRANQWINIMFDTTYIAGLFTDKAEEISLEEFEEVLAALDYSKIEEIDGEEAKETYSIQEVKALVKAEASKKLSDAIFTYLENDAKTHENYETRIKKLEWWAPVVAEIPGGLSDLRIVAKQFIWDNFFKGVEQVTMLEQKVKFASEAGASEQEVELGASKFAWRYLDTVTKEPVYVCQGSTACPPSLIKLILGSKTDPVVNAKANQKVSAQIYGFMVVWENSVMFKTNEPRPEGKEPGPGAACAIVSNVKSHRMKLIDLGNILAGFSANKNTMNLTEDILATSPRKLQGAPSFCALMEIVLRWMDIRRSQYGGLRYFYRPLSSFYSKHKSKR